MFEAAQIMSGESPPIKDKCIINYELKQRNHVFTLMQYNSGIISQLVLSNLLFDNGFNVKDISDTNLRKRDNGCWSLEFCIHNREDISEIVSMKNITFIDNRLWVTNTKLIKNTRWKHPFTETSSGVFNARSGLCSNTMDMVRVLINTGYDLENRGFYKIRKINKYGFMQIETDRGLVVQHLNNFDKVKPEDVIGVWYNDNLNLWMFENTEQVNVINEACVYLLLDTHSRQTRFYSKTDKGPIHTYDYTKAKAFFSEVEALKYAERLNNTLHTTFTAEQWV